MERNDNDGKKDLCFLLYSSGCTEYTFLFNEQIKWSHNQNVSHRDTMTKVASLCVSYCISNRIEVLWQKYQNTRWGIIVFHTKILWQKYQHSEWAISVFYTGLLWQMYQHCMSYEGYYDKGINTLCELSLYSTQRYYDASIDTQCELTITVFHVGYYGGNINKKCELITEIFRETRDIFCGTFNSQYTYCLWMKLFKITGTVH